MWSDLHWKQITLAIAWRLAYNRANGEGGRPVREAAMFVKVKDDGGSDQAGHSAGDGQSWQDAGYTLEVELIKLG